MNKDDPSTGQFEWICRGRCEHSPLHMARTHRGLPVIALTKQLLSQHDTEEAGVTNLNTRGSSTLSHTVLMSTLRQDLRQTNGPSWSGIHGIFSREGFNSRSTAAPLTHFERDD